MNQRNYTFAALRAAQKHSKQSPFWESLQEQDAQQMYAQAKARVRNEGRFSMGVVAAAGLVAAIYAVQTWSQVPGMPAQYGWVEVFAGVMLTGVCAAIAGLVALMVSLALVAPFSLGALAQQLEPAKDHPQLCSLLVDHLKYPAVAQFRDKVTANGRQLRYGDLLHMCFIADEARAQQDRSSLEQNCRKLHGPVPADAQA